MNAHDDIDPHLQQALRDRLQQSANDIDPVSAARLRAARRRACDAASSVPTPRWRWLMAGAPVAAVVVLAVLMVERSETPPAPTLASAPKEAVRDLDLLTSGENLDLLDDLEFFRWLPAERSS